MPRWPISLSIVAVPALALGVGAQTHRGDLRGTVVDATTERPIAAATILLGDSLGITSTDSAGRFLFTSVEEGLYTLRARRLGFHPDEQVNVRVTRDKTTIVTFMLTHAPVRLATTHVDDTQPLGRDADAPVGHFTYSADEIRRTPGAAGDIFRAIETLPGVSSSGGEFSAFSVRGGGPHDNLIFIDDIPFDKVTHLEGGIESDEAQGGRFSIFAPDLVHSAEFQAGGFGAQYGGKTASLLSLHLRDGNTTTTTYSGRYDLLGWEADYDGPSRIDPHTSILFAARHENFERALKLIGRADAGTPSFTDVIFKSTTRLGGRNTISTLGVVAPEQVVRTVANILTEADTDDTALYSWRETKAVGGISWRLLAGTSSVIQTSLFASRFTRHNALGEAYPDIPIDGGSSIASRASARTDNRAESRVGVRSLGRFSLGRMALLLSLEASRHETRGAHDVSGADTVYTFDQYDVRPPGQNFVVLRPETYDSRYKRWGTTIGTSASIERALGDDGKAVVGARYENSGVTGRDDVLPRASIAFPTVRGLAFNLAAGVYLQDPELALLAANSLNTSLPAERSTHFVAGVSRLLRSDVQLTVEGYYRSLSDLAVLQSQTTGLEAATGTGFSSGVDVDLVKRLTDRFFGQASYSYAVSKRNDHRGAGAYDGDNNQPNIVNILAGYTLSATWSFSGKFKYATGRPTDDYIIHSDVLPGSGVLRYSREITSHNARRFADLQTLNLRVDYQKQARAIGIDAFLDILDAYNRLNVNNVRLVERSGRVVYDGVRIVPTFGLKLLY